MNKFVITFVALLLFNGIMLANSKIEKSIAQGNAETFNHLYDSEKMSASDKNILLNLTKAYKAQAQIDYENWPEEQINKKYIAHAAAKITFGLAIMGGLYYAAARPSRIRKLFFQSVPSTTSVKEELLMFWLICPEITPFVISVYLAKNDIEKGLHYKSFLKEKHQNLQTIERKLRK